MMRYLQANSIIHTHLMDIQLIQRTRSSLKSPLLWLFKYWHSLPGTKFHTQNISIYIFSRYPLLQNNNRLKKLSKQETVARI